MSEKSSVEAANRNPDPITGEPGSHPIGTGIGAAGGAAVGAAIGAVGGPVGMAIGGAIGAAVGGLAGKGVAEQIDPTAERAYWEANYHKEPYYRDDKDFADYGPAYQMTVERYSPESRFEDHEPELAKQWDSAKGGSRLSWEEARAAAKAGWDRLHHHRGTAVKEEDAARDRILTGE